MCVVSSSRALGGCIHLANHKELKDLKLETVRMLLLEDGANPCKSQLVLSMVVKQMLSVYG